MNVPDINSLSSGIMLGVTLYKNRSNGIIAEAGYALAFAVSVIESLAAVVCVPVTCMFYPLSDKPLEANINWWKSSSFCMPWSLADAILNIFCARLIADERSVRHVIHTGQIFDIPRGALI